MSDFTLESLAATLSEDPDNAQPAPPEAQNGEIVEAGTQQDPQDPVDPENSPPNPDELGPEDPDGQLVPPEPVDDRLVAWTTADGTAHEVTEKELRDGYMRQQDYTQKTQNLARDREQAEGEIQKRTQQSVQTMNLYGEKLGELHVARLAVAHLESVLQQTNREDDPAKYAAVQSDLLRAQQQGRELAGVLSQANQLMQEQQAEQTKKAQGETAKLLAAEMPDFNARLPVWNKHATETYGFSPQELAQVTDPRIFRLLDDATRFRDLQNRKPEAVKKAQAAPPARQTRSVQPSTIEKAIKRHDANRDLDSLAQVLMAKQRN